VPRNYLSKTLHRLAKRGVLVSERGPRGGFRLAKPAGALPVREVVSEFEEIRPSGRCLMGGLCDPLNPCVAHERWRWWTAEMTQMLDRTTVADFIAENGRRGANRPEVLALPAQHGREDAA
jgi:Rrf2 family iron-sulfur cluster assembly transcriptional regulator